MGLIKEIARHDFSNGSWGRITKFTTPYLGKTYSYTRFGGAITYPEIFTGLTGDKAFEMLANDLENDVMEN